MSIDIEIGTSLSGEDAAHFAAKTETITEAMRRVQEWHAAYSWVWTDEIRCRGCNASLDIPLLASTNANADKAFRAHQSPSLTASWLLTDTPLILPGRNQAVTRSSKFRAGLNKL